MGKEVNLSNSIERLASVFAYRWGKEIDFLRMLEADATLITEPRMLSAKDLLLPIHMESNFLGAVRVREAQDLSFETVDEMHSLSRLILQYPLYAQYTTRSLADYEMLMNGGSTASSSPEDRANLVSLFQNKAQNESTKIEDDELSEFSSEVDVQNDDMFSNDMFSMHDLNLDFESSKSSFDDDFRPNAVSQVFHIGGSGEKDLLRIADWIHSRLGNWSLLRWEDLQTSQAPLDELSSLGRCTIIVSDIASLDAKETEFINAMIGRSNDLPGDSPTFLLLTEASLEDIDKSQTKNQWLKSLESYSLDMRRVAVEPKKVMSTFELFFFN